MDLQTALSACLARLMRERALSVAALAHRSGVSRSTLYSILRPDFRETKLETLCGILPVLGLTLSQFFSQPEFFPDDPQ